MSFLYSWLSPPPAQAPQQDSIAAPSIEISDAHNDEEGNEAAGDEPPAFPALSSIQRSSAAGSNVVRVLDKDSIAMPPPPVPSSRIAPTSSGGLMSPPVTVKKMPNVNTKKKAREKVALTPGHSPLDWARLKSSGEDLRAGVTSLLRITPEELKKHNTAEDAWSAFGGKVYNITPYLAFHPGGQKELMRVAGRDGTRLFALTHSWVNLDYMLDGCMVGFLVPN